MSVLDTALVPEAVSALAGALAFPSVLASAQVLIFKPLQLTHSPSLTASLYGGLAVVAAGTTASIATAKAFSLLKEATPNTVAPSISTRDILLSALSSVVVYRALGGRYRAVLPSNLLRPGAFAADWIPASTGYASGSEKNLIQAIGKRYGCHSCGARRVKSFISDHQPPTKLFNSSGDMLSQRFYPHCSRCSAQQGGVLSKSNAKNPRSIINHFSSIRVHHLFLPMPFLFAFAYGEATPTKTGSGCGQDSLVSGPKVVLSQETQTDATPTKTTITGADLAELVNSFPIFILWKKMVEFLDSFGNVRDSFHITLWTFIIVAAMGTI